MSDEKTKAPVITKTDWSQFHDLDRQFEEAMQKIDRGVKKITDVLERRQPA